MIVWKEVEGYEGLYWVSNTGLIKSRFKILKTSLSKGKDYYLFVKLSDGTTWKSFRVHRLVAEAFIPNPQDYPCVNHKDEDKQNNNVDNLEWCDHKYNVNYGTSLERMVEYHKKGVKGVNVNTGEILYLESASEGKKYGFIPQHICSCRTSKRKTHKGFTWTFI